MSDLSQERIRNLASQLNDVYDKQFISSFSLKDTGIKDVSSASFSLNNDEDLERVYLEIIQLSASPNIINLTIELAFKKLIDDLTRSGFSIQQTKPYIEQKDNNEVIIKIDGKTNEGLTKNEDALVKKLQFFIYFADYLAEHSKSSDDLAYEILNTLFKVLPLRLSEVLWTLVDVKLLKSNPHEYSVKVRPGRTIAGFCNYLLTKIGNNIKYQSFAGRIRMLLSWKFQISDPFIVNRTGEINTDLKRMYLEPGRSFFKNNSKKIFSSFLQLQQMLSDPMNHIKREDTITSLNYWISLLTEWLEKRFESRTHMKILFPLDRTIPTNQIVDYDTLPYEYIEDKKELYGYFAETYNPHFNVDTSFKCQHSLINALKHDSKVTKTIMLQIFILAGLYYDMNPLSIEALGKRFEIDPGTFSKNIKLIEYYKDRNYIGYQSHINSFFKFKKDIPRQLSAFDSLSFHFTILAIKDNSDPAWLRFKLTPGKDYTRNRVTQEEVDKSKEATSQRQVFEPSFGLQLGNMNLTKVFGAKKKLFEDLAVENFLTGSRKRIVEECEEDMARVKRLRNLKNTSFKGDSGNVLTSGTIINASKEEVSSSERLEIWKKLRYAKRRGQWIRLSKVVT